MVPMWCGCRRGSLVVVVRELDVRVVVVDEGEVGVDEGQCVEHGKDPFAVPRLKYLPFVLFPLGVPSSPKSVVFFNIVQKGGGDQNHVQKFWSKFCMILKAFWQHKIDIKRLFKGRNVSNWG